MHNIYIHIAITPLCSICTSLLQYFISIGREGPRVYLISVQVRLQIYWAVRKPCDMCPMDPVSCPDCKTAVSYSCPRDSRLSASYRVQLRTSPENLPTLQHYGLEGFKIDSQFGPHHAERCKSVGQPIFFYSCFMNILHK